MFALFSLWEHHVCSIIDNINKNDGAKVFYDFTSKHSQRNHRYLLLDWKLLTGCLIEFEDYFIQEVVLFKSKYVIRKTTTIPDRNFFNNDDFHPKEFNILLHLTGAIFYFCYFHSFG